MHVKLLSTSETLQCISNFVCTRAEGGEELLWPSIPKPHRLDDLSRDTMEVHT